MTFTYSDDFKEILRIVGRGKKLQRDLTYDEAFAAMRLMLEGKASEAQIGAFLITMRVKDESSDELLGFLHAAKSMMQTFPMPQVDGLVDLGITYDGKLDTLQTGVGAALVIAAAGVPVLLHGADGIPTKQGVAVPNLLRALGCDVSLPPERVSQQIEEHCFGVITVDQLLPEWAALTPIRQQFGLRTGMNTVEKLFNPLDGAVHISGIYHKTYLERLAPVFTSERAWLVQGEEGSIDFKYGRKTMLFRFTGGEIEEVAVDASALGFVADDVGEVPNDPVAHAAIIREALVEQRGVGVNQIALTAGGLLWMAGRSADVGEGIEMAREAIRSGKAAALLKTLSNQH